MLGGTRETGGRGPVGAATAPRRRAALALAAAAAVLLGGCTQAPASLDDAAGKKLAERLPAVGSVSKVSFAVSPEGTGPIKPGQPVSITVAHGRLTSVSMIDADGHPVAGALAPDARSWRTTAALPLGSTLRYEAIGVDAGGVSATTSGELATLEPSKVLTTAISPLSGRTVGVGMPIVVRFNVPVTDKAAVQSRLTVHTSRPVEGAWSWVKDTEVHWRPKEFWPAYTTVTLDADLAGVDAGKDVWGAKSRSVKFSIGPSMVSTVDVKALRMRVVRDGKLIRTIPVTTGKDGFLTRNGTKVILEKFEHKIMDSTTVGIKKGSKEYYRLDVPYAMRVTWSGEFVHAAPWSVRNQGQVNVSHGCVGMSMANGQWLFDRTRVGDVVTVVNSPRPLESGNGYTDWNVAWSDWLAGSAA